MPIFCNTQTTVERQYFSAMKKRITWNSVQTWVTKIVKTTALFACNCLLTAQNLGANVTSNWFIGMIAEWSKYCALLDAVGGLRVVSNSKENLRQLIINEVTASVSEHSMKKTSVVAFMSKYCWCAVYRRNFADIILWQHGKIHHQFLVLRESLVLCWKVIWIAAIPRQTPYLPARCATVYICIYIM